MDILKQSTTNKFQNKFKMNGNKNSFLDSLQSNKRTKKLIQTQTQLNILSIPNKKIKSDVTTNSSTNNNFYETIPQIPTIQLNDHQMNQDPLALLVKLQEKYKEYGAVKLIASQGWNPPFTFRYADKGITTRVQNLHKLKYGKAFEQKIEEYSLKNYEGMARDFQRNYQMKTQPIGSTNESTLEMEYWSLVSDPKYQTNSKKDVIVQYAADLPALKYGSGFPTFKLHNWNDPDFNYETNLFNLNNVFKSPLSLLSMSEKRKQKISGITVPWVYMGMQFSTFCWHVEDLWINSLNYNHKGGVKTWYIIPQSDKGKFDNFVNNKYKTNSKKKNLLTRITYIEDPKQLIKYGIRVYKAYQHPREYICTFFKAYHCGFSQSFNIGEAVNFITAKSIPYLIEAEQYNQKHKINKPSVISLEWLMYQNIQKVKEYSLQMQGYIKDGYDRILRKQKQGIKMLLKEGINIRSLQIIPTNVKYDKNACFKCKAYLYLSFLKCLQCNKKYCFNHYQQCSHDQFNLVIRKVNDDRKQLVEFFPCEYYPTNVDSKIQQI